MFKMAKNIIFLGNLCLMVQIALCVEGETSGKSDEGVAGVPTTSVGTQTDPVPELDNAQILQQAHAITPNVDDLQLNRDAFEGIQYHFGNQGPLLRDLLTNPNALGKVFAKVSRIITMYIDFEKYRRSLLTIIEYADSINFAEKMGPLFEKIADVPDPTNNSQTFGQAVKIITNVLSDKNAVDEIRKRITGPNSIRP